MFPKTDILKLYSPVPYDVTIFGDRVLKQASKVRKFIRVGP